MTLGYVVRLDCSLTALRKAPSASHGPLRVDLKPDHEERER